MSESALNKAETAEACQPERPSLSIGSTAKMWKQLTDAEKIERMREVVHDLSSENQRLRTALRLYRRHSHAANGDIVVPIDSGEYGEGRTLGQANPNGPWF